MKKRHPALIYLLLSIALGCGFAQASSAKTETESSTAQQSVDPHYAEGVVNINVHAPADRVWGILTDFSIYPKVFSKIESVTVQKREGTLVYVESVLRKQMFVKNTVQHVVNDLSGKPGILKWQMTDGNFKHLDGEWTITPDSNDTCKIRYRLAVDAGSVVPAGLISWALRFMQHEIVSDLKQYVEKSYEISLSHARQGLSMSRESRALDED
jgi:ribosome-associated toxin RatA of RatAB toxin-antitoxin module